MPGEEKTEAYFLQLRGWITWSGRYDGGMAALDISRSVFLRAGGEGGKRVVGIISGARAEGFVVGVFVHGAAVQLLHVLDYDYYYYYYYYYFCCCCCWWWWW